MATASPTIEIRLQSEPVTFVARSDSPSTAGGECVFLGRTRLEVHDLHGPLAQLHYEAYVPLAERTLEDIARRAAERYRCHTVIIHHALGSVRPGEASVLVQVLCGHRAEAFDACRFAIDTLKREAPIWKREEWTDGTTWSGGQPVQAHTEGERP